MKKVRYTGDLEATIPMLNLTVNSGDVIDVPDDFANGNFEPVVETKQKQTKAEGDN
jgi:hypothetical protein